MSFNDDEPIVSTRSLERRQPPVVDGRVQLFVDKVPERPVEACNLRMMVDVIGGDSIGDRSGLDLVAVLDVSGSMQGEKIDKMKTAMQFVIKKLSPIDRLSIVTFSSASARLCPLRLVTEDSQPELLALVAGLRAGGNTNITDGLRTALKVIADRKLGGGRHVAVMLMSDGQQNQGGDAAQVVIGKVPVYTFGFGVDYDPIVLNAVANNSLAGTFYVVNDVAGLSLAFSQCIAGLVTGVVLDLALTFFPGLNGDSTIQKVTAGSYAQKRDADAGSVTVSFGGLYSKELRKIIVDLDLPSFDDLEPGFDEATIDILKIKISYTFNNLLSDANPSEFSVVRTTRVALESTRPSLALQAEEARLNTVTMIKEARTLADGKNMVDARDKLVEAQNALEDLVDQSNPVVDMLRTELQQLIKLMKSQDVYEELGRSYALASETSHDRQRFASRGEVEGLRLFATPRMDTYLEQAKKFDENPTAPLPSVDEDVKVEVAANPLGLVAGPITFYLQTAIQALQAISKLINGGKA